MSLSIVQLQELDEHHVRAWTNGTSLIEYAGRTRVISQGETHTRTHVWPGDPDDVADYLRNRGFSVQLALTVPVDAHRETVVYVTERLP